MLLDIVDSGNWEYGEYGCLARSANRYEVSARIFSLVVLLFIPFLSLPSVLPFRLSPLFYLLLLVMPLLIGSRYKESAQKFYLIEDGKYSYKIVSIIRHIIVFNSQFWLIEILKLIFFFWNG